MSDSIKITIPVKQQQQKDLLIAQLSEIGFDGFEEGPHSLLAYCDVEHFNEDELKTLLESRGVPFDKEIVKEQNWNENWEKNFHPVRVDDFCAIRAFFHPEIKDTRFDIVITPKMSFGTGHHATTFMMIKWMKEINHEGKSVLDFGTGTGVLAILAEKLGAAKIEAIDNDYWSIENAGENILFNKCSRIVLQKADSLAFNEQFDIILANINKNVLLGSMKLLQQHLAVEGVVVISGLLEGDRSAIETAANQHQLAVKAQLEKNGWIALQLTHY